jgi:hypothetical protein
MTSTQAAIRQAEAESLRAQLQRELQLAHEIIRNALALMTPAQRTDWALMNAASGNDSEGTTRFHERAAVIARATGEAA